MSNVREIYQKELKKLPSFSEEETLSLYEKYLNGQAELLPELVNGNLFRLDPIVRSKNVSDDLYLDLMQEGSVAIFTLFSDLKPAKENLFDEMDAMIKEAIRSYIDEEQKAHDANENLTMKLNVLDEVCRKITEKTGKEPTVEEISEILKLPEDEIRYLLKISLSALNREG